MIMLISYNIYFLLVILLNFCYCVSTMCLYFADTICFMILLRSRFGYSLVKLTCHSFNNLFCLLHNNLNFCFDNSKQFLNLCIPTWVIYTIAYISQLHTIIAFNNLLNFRGFLLQGIYLIIKHSYFIIDDCWWLAWSQSLLLGMPSSIVIKSALVSYEWLILIKNYHIDIVILHFVIDLNNIIRDMYIHGNTFNICLLFMYII